MADFSEIIRSPELLIGTLIQLFKHEGKTTETEVLMNAEVNLEETNYDNWNGGTYTFRLNLQVPIPLYAKLGKGRKAAESSIYEKAQAILRAYPNDYIGSVLINPQLQGIAGDSKGNACEISDKKLVQEIESQRNLMISVSTGGPKIAVVNEEYRQRRDLIGQGLKERHLPDPNPYKDLWDWYGKWSSGDLPSWQSRRQYIAELYASLTDRLIHGPAGRGADIFEEPTGWARIDRSIGEARVRLAEAETEEQYQAIGLLCRETLISLAQIVFDPTVHKTIDEVKPSETDAKRMLEAYLNHEFRGETNEVARRHAKAALALADKLVHKRTATFRDAALCAEATTTVINIVAIVSGRRDPK